MLKLKCKNIDWQIVLILAVAIFFRFFLLDLRPAHHDEGVFGWFADQIMANGFYRYDPTNYHGPLHHYILFLSQTLFGRSNIVLRLPDAIISIVSVYWIFLFSPFFGRRTCLVAALSMAVSPGITYFGKYAFQESFLVFYTILVFWGITGLWYEGKKKYLWAIGTGVTLMILTKETYIIHSGCFVLAWITLKLWERVLPSDGTHSCAVQEWNSQDLLKVVLCGVGLIMFFYSGTFFYPKGVSQIFESFQVWSKTGISHGGHAKPFFYWFYLIWQYEHITLLGIFLVIRYIFPSSKLIRYIAIYGIGVFLAYSLVPYKTPWCIINILWPFFFVFSDIASKLLEGRRKLEIQAALTVIFLVSILIACRINFITYDNNKEKYVYVHTFREIKKLTEPVFKLVEKDYSAYNLTGHVLRSDEWPIPWIFGDFTMIGYYWAKLAPQIYDADFLVAEKNRIKEVESKLTMSYFTDTFTLRDAQDSSKIYFSFERFKNVFPSRKPELVSPNNEERVIR